MAAAAVAGGLVLAAGGATVYAASNPTPAVPAATPSAAPTAKAAAGHRGLLARTDHATLEVRQDGKWVTVDVDRGNVTSASTTSITLMRPDGQSVTVHISSSTKFRGKEATSAAALKTGVRAMVVSESGTATSVTEGAKPLPAVH
jgi:hypothetical protein